MDILWILPITAFSNNGKCLAINIFPHPLAYDVKNILRGNPMKEYIEEEKVTDYQDHFYPSEMAVDAMIQTYLLDGDMKKFLKKFDEAWVRYNRDLIDKVQKYESEHQSEEG